MSRGDTSLAAAILTQAVEDAKYTGLNKKYLKHKIQALNWIINNDPMFDFYCKLVNLEPSYIINKTKLYSKITYKQKVLLKPIVNDLLKSKSYNNPSSETRMEMYA
jgi:Txe/YoeB family toxin of Txe-Axe toxin-antitoxin module